MARVLLIEDEPWLGELYRALLSAQHDVVWIRDPYTVMDTIDQDHPDIIVLDILLPGASGVQLLHELASYGDTAHIPKILFSAAVPAGFSGDALRAYGVVETLDKTAVRPKQVLQTINDILAAYANA